MIDIKQYLKNIVKKYLDTNDGAIIVIKGIDPKLLDISIEIDMSEILQNKTAYFFKIAKNDRKIITYDEYIALYELITMQFKKIIIFENNIYMNYYPLFVKVPDEKLNALVNHYDEEKEGDSCKIGDITDYTAIYGNICFINNNYYIIYNDSIENEKEETIQVFNRCSDEFEKEEVTRPEICYDILNEENYITMIQDINENNRRKIYILEKNISLNKIILQDKLKTIKNIYEDSIDIKVGIVKEKNYIKPVRQEFINILKKHWGYNSFRKMKVYNINKINNKEKSIEGISQSDIISDIVDETENCIKGKDYRDIFVTAPTGAGKSVIFQIPAIYLAKKYDLFTIVISPLIGLMKDQVTNLELHNYKYARTINSDISPIQKQEILNDIADGECNILYLSPESLLSKSDLEQIIGKRILGLLVVDEAHIVTTWGKQFRPDYWYLGNHLNKIKKAQIDKKGIGFVIATFTATAIYGGIENMYEETIDSLKMVDPITYLGYVKREDININIEKSNVITDKTGYELVKFEQLIQKIDEVLMFNKKMLIYFPTVALINRFWDYCAVNDLSKYVSRYHGQLTAYDKEENYNKFLNNQTPIMLATKAFGMGIDIDDIEVVAHFSPTGNVCDYVQEIGRAARKPNLNGEAYYNFMKNDFKHINRLHGLSVIKEYQLVQVIKKVYELYKENIKSNSQRGKGITKKKNEMLVDAENFAHIFENPFFSEDDGINKVKTAMLLIQKDFERRFSFSPFHVRPIPLFEIGFFKIEVGIQKKLVLKYGSILDEIDDGMHICSVNLKKIWEKSFSSKYSFPKFKYMFYSKDEQLQFEYKYDITPALSIDIKFNNNYMDNFNTYINAIKTVVNRSVRKEEFYDLNEIIQELMKEIKINNYKAKSITELIISAMSVYQRDFSRNIHAKMFVPKLLKSGELKYKFLNGSAAFFKWIEDGYYNITKNLNNGNLYLVDETSGKGFKETLLILGILETLDLLVFKALGGKNSQIYIYVNQTKTMLESKRLIRQWIETI